MKTTTIATSLLWAAMMIAGALLYAHTPNFFALETAIGAAAFTNILILSEAERKSGATCAARTADVRETQREDQN